MAQVLEPQVAPEFLVIGHVTRDLLPDGRWRLGGTVTFAALAAQRLGMRAATVTSAPPDVVEALQHLAPDILIATVPSPDATTFENIYQGSIRSQYLRGRATLLTLDHVPVAWRSASVVLLAPLAQEVDPQLITSFPQSLVAATPQGWLRRWNDDGFVMPGALDAAVEAALPSLHALILSREDLLPPPGHEALGHYTPTEADAQIVAWARVIPIVAVTRSVDGALLLCQGHDPEAFPGYPAREVDPTGAGDVFATAFLCHLHTTGDPRAAADFANRVAAISVEHTGASGIPTQAEVTARFG
ncbi:MAG: PfkB family carbohydrate kinase [Ktedonobacterales bacterium]